MAESHGTREFIGGGELAASGDCGANRWDKRMSSGNAWILPWLNHTERVNS